MLSMEKELYFLRSSEQYLAKSLLKSAFNVDEFSLENFPLLQQYERQYGSFNGDTGVYILANNVVVGGAWVRLLANGSGFIDHDTPEAIVFVKPEFRKQGFGLSIMEQLFIEVAKSFSTVSLCLEEKSEALPFFEKLGFKRLDNSECENAVKKPAFKMLKKLENVETLKEEKHLEEACFKKSFQPRHND